MSDQTCPRIILVGIHGSGKTTIGGHLGRAGYDFHDEIGKRLREESTKSVEVSQEDFDRAVMVAELARDKSVLGANRKAAIETWHFGNLAFALTRGSNSVASEYGQALDEAVDFSAVHVVRLTIEDDTFVARCNEPGIEPLAALAFYRTVEENLLDILARFSATVRVTELATDGADAGLVTSRVLAAVDRKEGSTQ